MKNQEEIIVFIKNPELGKVKTRLAKTIGNNKALAIYLRLIDHTLSEISISKKQSHLFFSEVIDKNFIGNKYSVQEGIDLGERMKNAFEISLEKNTKSIIIGTDCPGITAEIIQQAFYLLEENDVVIGPALDGGYYLLGLKNNTPEIFEGMEWSTESVFDNTVKRLNELKLSWKELPKLRDLDNEEDLVTLSKDFGYLHIER